MNFMKWFFNMEMQTFLEHTDFLLVGYMFCNRLLDHMIILFLIFWGTSTVFSIMDILIYGTDAAFWRNVLEKIYKTDKILTTGLEIFIML